MNPSIHPEAAQELAKVIVGCGEHAASALVDLIYAIADPEGDKFRYETAWVVIRQAIPFVPEFDALCQTHCERQNEVAERSIKSGANVS